MKPADDHVLSPIDDRRHDERIGLMQSVVLQCTGLGLVRGQAKNISQGGMYIKTGRVALSTGQRVGICVVVNRRSGRKLYQVQARILRVTEEGAALEFKDNHETIDELKSAMTDQVLN